MPTIHQIDLLPNPATIDRALARPTLSVVFGSLRGGTGAGDLPSVPPITTLLLPLRGKVAYCLWIGWLVGNAAADWEFGRLITGETTVIRTNSPDFLIRSTTCSCEAVVTSSPLILNNRKRKVQYNLKHIKLWNSIQFLEIKVIFIIFSSKLISKNLLEWENLLFGDLLSQLHLLDRHHPDIVMLDIWLTAWVPLVAK